MNYSNSRVSASILGKTLVALFSTIAVVGSVSGDAAADEGGCHLKSGPFVSYLVAPPACTSPIGVCTLGTLTGGFKGTYFFTMDTIAWGGDPTDPSMFVYTGHSLITDRHGFQIIGH